LSSPDEILTDLLPLLNIHPRPEVWGVYGLQRLQKDGGMALPHLDERTLDGLSDADRWLGYQQVRGTLRNSRQAALPCTGVD
jgi:hypothetical protein